MANLCTVAIAKSSKNCCRNFGTLKMRAGRNQLGLFKPELYLVDLYCSEIGSLGSVLLETIGR